MSVPVIAFFNNKGGVGKTSLVYHVAWMLSDLGNRVVAVDLDPQANLTSAFLDEESLDELWETDGDHPLTVFDAVQPLATGAGDIRGLDGKWISDRLALVQGDMGLSTFEDDLAETWSKCLDGDERAFRIQSAFWRIVQQTARQARADFVVLDLGPNLGAINRSALISADWVVIPVAPDLLSLQGLRNLGPALRQWRESWGKRLREKAERRLNMPLPQGDMKPLGYVMMQHSVRRDRPVKAYQTWAARIPGSYRTDVLNEAPQATEGLRVENDDHCLAMLKHYRSLVPLAQDARKPIFHLKAADGALGAHPRYVEDARQHFSELAEEVVNRIATEPSSQLAAHEQLR